MHTYDAALEDFQKWAPKIRANGFIMGDDFAEDVVVQRQNFSLVQAVKDFLQSNSFEILLQTTEAYSNFLLVRKPLHPRIQKVMLSLVEKTTLIEVPGALSKLNFYQHMMTLGGQNRVVPCRAEDPHKESFFASLRRGPAEHRP